MKVALITTTVNVPKVLEIYRHSYHDARFFVAGDLKTPPEVQSFCDSLGNCVYLSVEHQKDLNYKSSELIGFSTDSRRNIALLEALKWGAEIIVSVDDDMIPSSSFLFFDFIKLFDEAFYGLKLGTPGHWLDAGAFTLPPAKQRGLPTDTIFDATPGFVINARIGVVQGIILGVPDTDSMTAITNQPFVHTATDILKNGFVADLESYAVFNSQIVAFRRELAPCFAQFYKWQGRNTDIIASVLMRRVMRSRELYTYYGLPSGFHARAKRPLFKDLQYEMFGLSNVAPMAHILDALPENNSVVDFCRFCWEHCEVFSEPHREAGLAWCEDCAAVGS